jgi:CBS domain-containing protein
MGIVDVMNARLVSVAPDVSVEEAIGKMLSQSVGSVVVCEGTHLRGIFTERDVLRLAGHGARMDELEVRQVMTTRVLTVSPDADILEAASLMREHRVRHLPVVVGDDVLGVLGMRDVLDALAERLFRTHDPGLAETVHELLARRQG